ncbi:Vacuolar protein sorting-associated protein 33A [Trachymyrmex cornetzi]|uniref:Vacuolar protein sorting-associated protein 33A n=1 Tax=Trachymyrmex cornetzi TaxID=471704 RepID=A0A195ECD7_9HYME|nr:Vacuolar protein sorting-associated protein 33A [Trachymyrmex cornetzi]
MYPLYGGTLIIPPNIANVIFISRPQLELMDLIAENVHRDKNFNDIEPVLSKKAKVISSQYDERHGDKNVQEIKQFVARLPYMLATKQLEKAGLLKVAVSTTRCNIKESIKAHYRRRE